MLVLVEAFRILFIQVGSDAITILIRVKVVLHFQLVDGGLQIFMEEVLDIISHNFNFIVVHMFTILLLSLRSDIVS